MQKPIKAVFHEGGVRQGGPLAEELEARGIIDRPGGMIQGSASAPDLHDAGSERSRSMRSGSQRSQSLANLGATIAGPGGVPTIHAPLPGHMAGEGRISDVIRV